MGESSAALRCWAPEGVPEIQEGDETDGGRDTEESEPTG